jgi:5-methylthioadenosine/S-adenosylhomocysteine deaminase
MKTQNNVRTLFKGGAVITMDAALPNLATGDVLVDGNRIAAVGANIQADGAEVIDASERIVMPGLIDAHHHMWLGVVRRMMPNVDDLTAYFDLIGRKMGLKYRPLDMHLSTKLTAVASLDAGITSIIDACHLSISPEHTDAALDALEGRHPRASHGGCAFE